MPAEHDDPKSKTAQLSLKSDLSPPEPEPNPNPKLTDQTANPAPPKETRAIKISKSPENVIRKSDQTEAMPNNCALAVFRIVLVVLCGVKFLTFVGLFVAVVALRGNFHSATAFIQTIMTAVANRTITTVMPTPFEAEANNTVDTYFAILAMICFIAMGIQMLGAWMVWVKQYYSDSNYILPLSVFTVVFDAFFCMFFVVCAVFMRYLFDEVYSEEVSLAVHKPFEGVSVFFAALWIVHMQAVSGIKIKVKNNTLDPNTAMEMLGEFQREYKCCGAFGPDDYWYMNYIEIKVGETPFGDVGLYVNASLPAEFVVGACIKFFRHINTPTKPPQADLVLQFLRDLSQHKLCYTPPSCCNLRYSDPERQSCFDANQTGQAMLDGYEKPNEDLPDKPFDWGSAPCTDPQTCIGDPLTKFGEWVEDLVANKIRKWLDKTTRKVNHIFNNFDIVTSVLYEYKMDVNKVAKYMVLLEDLDNGTMMPRTMHILRNFFRGKALAPVHPEQLYQDGCIRQVLRSVWGNLYIAYCFLMYLIVQAFASLVASIGFFWTRHLPEEDGASPASEQED